MMSKASKTIKTITHFSLDGSRLNPDYHFNNTTQLLQVLLCATNPLTLKTDTPHKAK